jgi:hypothetical protein
LEVTGYNNSGSDNRSGEKDVGVDKSMFVKDYGMSSNGKKEGDARRGIL